MQGKKYLKIWLLKRILGNDLDGKITTSHTFSGDVNYY